MATLVIIQVLTEYIANNGEKVENFLKTAILILIGVNIIKYLFILFTVCALVQWASKQFAKELNKR